MGNTRDEIRDRMLALIPSDLDSSEGSFIRDSIMPAAIELALAYMRSDEIIALGFAQTTYGQYLDYRAGEHGLTRKFATKATGQVTVSGSNGTTVMAGSLFATSDGIQFQTTAEVSIGPTGEVTVNIEAAEAGAAGNVPAAAINSIPVSIVGVTGVANAAPTTGGANIETDADLLARFLEKVRQPATSGNVAHYRQWAFSVPGVGGAQVIPLWNGPGTVKVVLLGTDMLPAGGSVVTAVQDLICPSGDDAGSGLAPVGATVTVVAATAVTTNVTATISLSGTKTLAEIQPAFQAALVDYLAGLAFSADSTVRYVKIGAVLLDQDGVGDYADLLINSGTSNISIDADEVAVMGSVVLS